MRSFKNIKIFLFATIFTTAVQLCFADTNSIVVKISEIRQRAEAATMPAQSYSATVHQTIWHVSPITSFVLSGNAASSQSVQTNEIEEADYEVRCSTSGELHANKGLSLKSNTQSTNANSTSVAPVQNARLMISMNPINALRHMETLNSAIISDDVYQNIPCFKISATGHRFGFILWVSKTNSYVCRQIILQDSNTLFDAQFEYKKWNNCFVPLHTVITKPSNGTRVTQDFSGHAF
jgi:hypothetical protein